MQHPIDPFCSSERLAPALLLGIPIELLLLLSVASVPLLDAAPTHHHGGLCCSKGVFRPMSTDCNSGMYEQARCRMANPWVSNHPK